jgi:hypothetical protein
VTPVLPHSFTEQDRSASTCFHAANWLPCGQTKGRGRMDRACRGGQPIKVVWLYPLPGGCRCRLTDARLSAAVGDHG